MFQTRHIILRPGLIPCFALMAFGTIIGCSSDQTQSESNETTAANVKKDALADAEQCRNKLSAAISRLSVDRFATLVDAERSVSGLNSWVASCSAEEISETNLDDQAMELLNDNPRVTSQRFTGSDGYYVRDCLMLRDLSDSIISRVELSESGQGRELARVNALFDWVNRHISLQSADTTELPLSLFDVMLLGEGTPDYRAWLFAELLRQQQVDAVLIQTDAAPENSEEEQSVSNLLATSAALVAVIHEDGGWLFDCHAGVPVPEGEKLNFTDPRPAPLTSLLEHPRWKSATIQLIAQASTFAPRMLILQDSLASSDAAILYEELNGSASDIRPLLQRVVDGSDGQWKQSQISVWPFPDEMSIASHALTEGQQRQLDQKMRFFDAPFERSIVKMGDGQLYSEDTDALTEQERISLTDEERKAIAQQRMRENFERMMDAETATSEDRFGRASKKLLRARMNQISGDLSTVVVQQLQQVLVASMEKAIRVAVPEIYQKNNGLPPVAMLPLPTMIKEVNESSTGNSMYWAALCQFERGEAGSAVITFGNYRRQHPDGRRKYPSMLNEAMAHLARDRASKAIAVLKLADQPDNPEQLRAQILLDALQE